VTVLDCVSKIARLSGSDGFGPRLPGLRGRRVSKRGPDELSDIGGFGRDEELPANLGRHASRECTIVFRRHRPRRRTIQYSRDASDGIDRPRRTGYPPSRVWRSVLPRQCRFARNDG